MGEAGALCPGLGQGSAQPTQPDGPMHRPEALGAEGRGADSLTSLSLSYLHLQIWVSPPWQRDSEKCSKVKIGEVPGTVLGAGQGLRRCQFPPAPLRFLAKALPRNL